MSEVKDLSAESMTGQEWEARAAVYREAFNTFDMKDQARFAFSCGVAAMAIDLAWKRAREFYQKRDAE